MKRYTVVEIEMDRKQEHKKKRVEKLEKKKLVKNKTKGRGFLKYPFSYTEKYLVKF